MRLTIEQAKKLIATRRQETAAKNMKMKRLYLAAARRTV